MRKREKYMVFSELREAASSKNIWFLVSLKVLQRVYPAGFSREKERDRRRILGVCVEEMLGSMHGFYM